MKILKFGGSSVANPERIRVVERVVREEEKHNRVIVVVSAFQGTTDDLIACARAAEKGSRSSRDLLKKISSRHLSVLKSLLQGAKRRPTASAVRRLLDELDRKSTRLNSSHSDRSRMPSSA